MMHWEESGFYKLSHFHYSDTQLIYKAFYRVKIEVNLLLRKHEMKFSKCRRGIFKNILEQANKIFITFI